MMSIIAPTRQTLRHLRRLCLYSPFLVEPVGVAAASQTHHKRTPSYPLSHLVSRSSRQQQTRTICVSSTRPQESQRAATTSSSDKPDSSTTTAPLPDISTYYTLFPNTLSAGPPPTGPFDIPLAQLKREFLRLQSQHHPDKYTSQPTAHQKALALSSLLNSAYKTLSDPLLRARYLLHHTYGIDITSEDNSTHSGLTDQQTLMEVMEAQEAIEEADTQEQIDALKEENQARIDQTIKLLGQAFEKEDVDAAKTECIRLNYWRSLQQGLHEWEPGKEVRLIH